MYGNGFGSPSIGSGFDLGGGSMGGAVWTIVSLILSIIGCFIIYFLFLQIHFL